MFFMFLDKSNTLQSANQWPDIYLKLISPYLQSNTKKIQFPTVRLCNIMVKSGPIRRLCSPNGKVSTCDLNL